MQYVTCNLCGADDTRPIAIQNGYSMVRCNRCRLVYVNPRPASEALIKMYNDYHQRDNKDEHTWDKLMERNFREVTLLLSKLFPGKGMVLDIGCGYGHFVEMMKNSGWTAKGIEPSSRTISYAKSKGLDVMETTIDEAVFPENSFEAVTAFYVLEHLFDPLSSLSRIHAILKPGGVAVFRVPHTTPIVRLLSFLKIGNNLYDMPFHLYDFSPETIKPLLEKAGFTSIRITPGAPTLPDKYSERITSVLSGGLASLLFSASGGKMLLPGTSKTVIAFKKAAFSDQHSAIS